MRPAPRFRDETEDMAAHRNQLEANLIESNGVQHEALGIRVRGETKDPRFTGNVIRDTRGEGGRRQTVGVLIEENAGSVELDSNTIEAQKQIDDRRGGNR